MLKTAKHITTTLSDAAILALVTGGIYWELADQDAAMPFANYSFKASKKITKDGIREYEVKLRVFAENLNAVSTIAETISERLDLTSRWKENPDFINMGYTDNEAKEAFIELTYNFKL
jgi:hypothetical protein